MTSIVDPPEEPSDRLDRSAVRSTLSLAGQERWRAGVQAGLEDADRGDFATAEEIATVLPKYSRA